MLILYFNKKGIHLDTMERVYVYDGATNDSLTTIVPCSNKIFQIII
jgi:hypothetical protein